MSHFYSKGGKNKVGLDKQLVSKHNHLEVCGTSCFAGTTWPCEKYWFLLILLLASSGFITVWVVLSQSWDDFHFLTVEDFQVDTSSVRKMSDLPRCGERGFGVQKKKKKNKCKGLEAGTWGWNKWLLEKLKEGQCGWRTVLEKSLERQAGAMRGQHRLTGCSWGKGCFWSPNGHLVTAELGAQRSGSHTGKEHWILSQRYVCPSPHFATEKHLTLGKFFSKKWLYWYNSYISYNSYNSVYNSVGFSMFSCATITTVNF